MGKLLSTCAHGIISHLKDIMGNIVKAFKSIIVKAQFKISYNKMTDRLRMYRALLVLQKRRPKK